MQFTIFTATVMHLVLPPEILRYYGGGGGVNTVHYGLCEDGESKIKVIWMHAYTLYVLILECITHS